MCKEGEHIHLLPLLPGVPAGSTWYRWYSLEPFAWQYLSKHCGNLGSVRVPLPASSLLLDSTMSWRTTRVPGRTIIKAHSLLLYAPWASLRAAPLLFVPLPNTHRSSDVRSWGGPTNFQTLWVLLHFFPTLPRFKECFYFGSWWWGRNWPLCCIFFQNNFFLMTLHLDIPFELRKLGFSVFFLTPRTDLSLDPTQMVASCFAAQRGEVVIGLGNKIHGLTPHRIIPSHISWISCFVVVISCKIVML